MKNLGPRLSLSEVEAIILEHCGKSIYVESMYKEAMNKILDEDQPICSVCTTSICISNQGNVYPCEGWQGFCVGNITDCSLEDIWTSSEKVLMLRHLKLADFSKCLNCEYIRYCSPCLYRNANENNGDFLKTSTYFCKIAELKKRIIKQNLIKS